MNNDDMSEDEFDAFLNGKDDLSRRLRALPQQGPSAELDAAILSRVKLALAQEQRPEAANDPAEEAPTPRLQPNFATRWRLPVGIAATVLAGVFAHQAFQVTQEARLAEAMPAAAPVAEQSAPAVEAAPLPAPAAVMADAAAPPAARPVIAEQKAAAPRLQERPKFAADEVRELARARVAKPAPAPVAEEAPLVAAPPPPPPAPAAPAPAPAPAVSSKPEVAGLASAVPMPAPAPASEKRVSRSDYVVANATSTAPKKASAGSELVTITGSRIANAAPSGTPALEWLALIESLLKADLKRDALGEWRRFRAEYPSYPVPEELQAKIKAIEP